MGRRLDLITALLLGIAVLTASGLLTGVVRRLALSRALIDVPNARSSHTRSTARGGGLAVVITATASFLALRAAGILSSELFLALAIGGGATALIGLLDDVASVRPGVRLLVHLAAALWALHTLGGLPAMRFGEHLVHLGSAGYVLGALGIVWVVNLFNFMDGIDGIAATEAVFMTCAAVLAAAIGSWAAEVLVAAWVLACASAGFLCWNWPPAKVFLGDVGSGYLGYVIAILALASGRSDPVAIWIWLILGGVFFVDATTTLIRRWLRGERVSEAHRSHAYQWLARNWGSHSKVTGTVLAINLVWLLPWSVLAVKFPAYAVVSLICAFAPLALLALLAGAGRQEHGF
jgi:Fuc2NAc and GlcNAc transferase